MLHYRLLDENATPRELSLLQGLLDNRQKTHFESRLMKMHREHAWVQPGHFYVLAMEGEYPVGFVFCVKHAQKIEVDSYYTHSKYRHQNVATKLTLRLIALARKQGMKRVTITNALASILEMARKMKASPRRYRPGSAQFEGIPPERFMIQGNLVDIRLRSREQLARLAHRRSLRRPN